jgi:RNA polymerase sigma-70 factor (ECF subfamily)
LRHKEKEFDTSHASSNQLIMSTPPQSLESCALQGIEPVAGALSLENEVLHLHDVFRLRLFRYATSLGLKVQDAEDVVQEVFIALFRHLQAGKSRSNLPGWIFRVTHNLALKRRTRYRMNGGTNEGEIYRLSAGPTSNPEEEMIYSERQLKLRRIFESLPEIDRLCLQLRAEGLKYREISQVLEISLGSVANCLGRSMSRLRRGEGGGACDPA